jgi:histidinol phosphatase-like enzyme (inositol monophosphatase family)
VDRSDTQGLSARLELARKIAGEAGKLTLEYFQDASLAVERKPDDSPVTIADREAEQLLRRRIEAAFSDDAIVGEELEDKSGTSGYQWILDPIDGTKSFISGVPLYGVLVAATYGGRAVLGAMDFPALQESMHGAVGEGAWYVRGSEPPQRAQVSPCEKLADAIFLTSEVRSFFENGRANAYLALQDGAKLSRTWGDCYGYLLVATGRADFMVDPVMNVWDAAALQPILEEAGGTFTDWQGRATIHSGEGIATNGRIFDEVMKAIRDCHEDRSV